jgi:glycosyltransferase involved in cell wall biosynthesis
MRRKIALFSGIYPPATGGPAKFAETFYGYCQENSIEITVYAYSALQEDRHVDSKVKLIPLSLPVPIRYLLMVSYILREAFKGSALLANGCFWEFSIAAFIWRFKYIAKIPGDIVWERAKNKGLTSDSIEVFQGRKINWRFSVLRKMFSYSLKKAECVIAPSDHLKGLAVNWGVASDKIRIVSNSISLTQFCPAPLKDKSYDFVTVSRLVPWKGIDKVIETSALLNQSLLIVGDGPDRERLERLSRQVGATTTFVGDIAQVNLPKLLVRASAFVLNSSFEATSYALLEAMACGLLVIANEKTGSEEILVHMKNGLLCGDKSGFLLIDAMKFCMRESQLTDAIRVHARETVAMNFNLILNYQTIGNLCLAI